MPEKNCNLSATAPLMTSQFIGEPFSEPSAPKQMTLRIVQGPLKPYENQAILFQYNRLAEVEIPMWEFLHWVQDSPEGPAWHAIFETDRGEIVGHTSLIPFSGSYYGRRLVPAKSEYSFIHEEYRTAKIRGFEKSSQLRNLLYVDQLFRRCRSEGWGPLFISTTSAVHRVFRSIACYPVEIPVWECLLILCPWQAAHRTPNLVGWQRASLGFAGAFQRTAWSCLLPFSPRLEQTCSVLPGDLVPSKQEQPLSFFEDATSLSWRYLKGQYECLVWDSEGRDYLITKRGSEDRYLRVCQWQLTGGQPSFSLIGELVRLAEKQGALGVRWAAYGDNEAAAKIARALRKLGFLCARRTRTLLVNSAEREFFVPETWNLTDAMFSFDP